MTKIEWTDETWNPVTGCTPISEGCRNCYAKRMARRLAGRCGYPPAPNHFDVTLHPDRLEQPPKWRKPRMIFVCSMSDLFHEDIADSYIGSVFDVALRAPQHTYQFLTKRSKRVLEFAREYCQHRDIDCLPANWWGLVTAENQRAADERIPDLLKAPWAVRGVSCEPLLGPVDIKDYLRGFGRFYSSTSIDWTIAGGETGPGARPMHPNWARGLRDQCQEAGVSFFFKQQIINGKKTRLLDGREWNEMP